MELSGVIKGLGWLFIIGGVVVGLIQGFTSDPLLEALSRYDEQSFRWTVAISWSFYGLVSGVLFLAASKALDYLEVIAHNSAIKTDGYSTSTGSSQASYPTTGKTQSKPSLESLSKSHSFKSID